MMTDPHPLRCVTCNRSTSGDRSCPLKDYVRDEEVFTTTFLEGALNIVGCASHSNHQSERGVTGSPVVTEGSKDWWNGYDFAFAEFIHWFWQTVEKGDKVGRMGEKIQQVRDWIVDHRSEQSIRQDDPKIDAIIFMANNHDRVGIANVLQHERQDERERVLEKIENFACSCIWSDAPDCPGAVDGEVICDGCERFEYSDPEDLRNYIKELRSGKQEGHESYHMI